MTYEEINWPKLSPMFRRAHNQLRQQRGLSPIPEPKIDLYVPPSTLAPESKAGQFNPRDQEFMASTREFLGPRFMFPGDEGFSVNGRPTK
jgi:hypothetical protein